MGTVKKTPEKTVLTLEESLNLAEELKKMMSEPTISFKVKYDLMKLLEKANKISESFEKIRFEIIKKYGKELPDTPGVYTLDKSPDYLKAIEELQKVAKKEEFFTESFNMDDFKDIKSSNPYYQIMKFIK